jgi:hypothetical protein
MVVSTEQIAQTAQLALAPGPSQWNNQVAGS